MGRKEKESLNVFTVTVYHPDHPSTTFHSVVSTEVNDEDDLQVVCLVDGNRESVAWYQARAWLSFTCTDEGQGEEAQEEEVPPPTELGLATTRELLGELKARGTVHVLAGEDGLYLAGRMARSAEILLTELPDDLLCYRTIDS